jgi:hypothetical protein
LKVLAENKQILIFNVTTLTLVDEKRFACLILIQYLWCIVFLGYWTFRKKRTWVTLKITQKLIYILEEPDIQKYTNMIPFASFFCEKMVPTKKKEYSLVIKKQLIKHDNCKSSKHKYNLCVQIEHNGLYLWFSWIFAHQ